MTGNVDLNIGDDESDEITTTFILDASGSMGSIQEEIVSAFNEQLETAQDSGENPTLNLVTFSNDEVRTKTWGEDAENLDPLGDDDYEPRGNTPMYDAVGSTLNRLLNEHPDQNHLVIVLSDGLENASREYEAEDVEDIVEEAETEGFEFLFIGTDRATREADNIGIDPDRTFDWQATSAGTRQVSGSTAQASGSYYDSGGQDVDTSGFDDDNSDSSA